MKVEENLASFYIFGYLYRIESGDLWKRIERLFFEIWWLKTQETLFCENKTPGPHIQG